MSFAKIAVEIQDANLFVVERIDFDSLDAACAYAARLSLSLNWAIISNEHGTTEAGTEYWIDTNWVFTSQTFCLIKGDYVGLELMNFYKEIYCLICEHAKKLGINHELHKQEA